MKRWQFILLAIGACAMSFSYGYSIQPERKPQIITNTVNACTAMLHVKPAKPIKLSELRP